MENEMKITMDSKSENESFSRMAIAAFISQLDPTLQDIMDIKTAVSEAVTNAIIHGYENNPHGKLSLACKIKTNDIYIEISDHGKGISDIEEAMTPLYTSKPEMERSGIGFTVMQSLMDNVTVHSEKNIGTTVIMTKTIQSQKSE